MAATIHAYDGSIAWLDAALDSVLTGLSARGLLDNTVVVVTSDHGKHLADHGRISHGNSTYRQLLQVPLTVMTGAG